MSEWQQVTCEQVELLIELQQLESATGPPALLLGQPIVDVPLIFGGAPHLDCWEGTRASTQFVLYTVLLSNVSYRYKCFIASFYSWLLVMCHVGSAVHFTSNLDTSSYLKLPTNGTGSGLYSVDLTQHSSLMLKPLHRHTPHLQKHQYICTFWSNAERRTVPCVLLRCFRVKDPSTSGRRSQRAWTNVETKFQLHRVYDFMALNTFAVSMLIHLLTLYVSTHKSYVF